jgi:GMP synthase (glutamine-hydrolysing)
VPPIEAATHSRHRASLLVLQPDPLDWLDRFSPWLAEEGLSTRVLSLDGDTRIPEVLAEDGLIVLGGAMSCLDGDHHLWLEKARSLIRNSVAQRRPVLGICLGGQLVAQAFGGKVTRGASGVEDGVITVHLAAAAAGDPLFAGMPPAIPVACWHEDGIVDLPEGATWLAFSDRYRNQAFRVGDLAWGVQFHPEVSPQTYERWVARAEEQLPGSRARTTPGLKQVQSGAAELIPLAEALARAFAREVLRSATHH